MEAAVDVFEERLNKIDTMGLEASREKPEAVAMHQEVPNEEAAAEAVGAQEDRSGDQRPTVGYRNPQKRRIKDNVVQGTPRGRMVQKRRRKGPECNNRIIDRGARWQLRLSKERISGRIFR
jgi:hypothetical protein